MPEAKGELPVRGEETEVVSGFKVRGVESGGTVAANSARISTVGGVALSWEIRASSSGVILSASGPRTGGTSAGSSTATLASSLVHLLGIESRQVMDRRC